MTKEKVVYVVTTHEDDGSEYVPIVYGNMDRVMEFLKNHFGNLMEADWFQKELNDLARFGSCSVGNDKYFYYIDKVSVID